MKPALPIRQRLSALTCLKAGPKAVLIEVCELAENGGRGCMASNDYLAKKLGVSLATMTRTVAFLVSANLLHSAVVKAEANRRYLSPSATVRACYSGGKEADQLAAAASLTIVKSETDYSQTSEVTIVKSETDYSQNASRVIGDDHDDQLDDQDDQRETVALAQKKNEELAEALAEARQDLITARQTITTLRADLDKLTKELAATRVGTQVAELPFASVAFVAVWRDHCLAKGIAANSPRERAQLAQLLKVAPTETLAIEAVQAATAAGWSKFYTPDEPRTQPNQPFGVAGHGQRTASPVHANAFGVASPTSLALATAIVVGGQRGDGFE